MPKRKISLQLPKDALQTLFKKAATTQYPDAPANIAETFRGRHIINTDNCIGCTLCGKDCPAGAIEFVVMEGKKRPMIHLDRCVFCYQCADSCPKDVYHKSKFFELAVTDKSTLLMMPPAPTPKPAPAPVASAPATEVAKPVSDSAQTP
jgi:formate hydrogenlyase subunit 6/NADH:ubiquinone oxidoreductase subunit I